MSIPGGPRHLPGRQTSPTSDDAARQHDGAVVSPPLGDLRSEPDARQGTPPPEHTRILRSRAVTDFSSVRHDGKSQGVRMPVVEDGAVMDGKGDLPAVVKLDLTSAKVFGRGGCNIVHLAPENVRGNVDWTVFKADGSANQPGALHKLTGIARSQPNWTDRSYATCVVDQLFGLGLVTRTRRAAMVDGKGALHEGIAMDVAPGLPPEQIGTLRLPLSESHASWVRSHLAQIELVAARQGFSRCALEDNDNTIVLENWRLLPVFDANGDPVFGPAGTQATQWGEGAVVIGFDFDDPVLRRELTRLQWFDALCGQVDRNHSNYMVAFDAAGHVTGVTAIDNDHSFGVLVGVDDTVLLHAPLPGVIDAATRKQLLDVTPAQLGETLRRELKGRLSAAEIDAARERLRAIQARLQAMSADGILTEDAQWASTETADALGILEKQAPLSFAEALAAARVEAAARQAGGAADQEAALMPDDEIAIWNRGYEDGIRKGYAARDSVHTGRVRDVYNTYPEDAHHVPALFELSWLLPQPRPPETEPQPDSKGA